jgi:tetratricopeptide (TPR) repeat protein
MRLYPEAIATADLALLLAPNNLGLFVTRSMIALAQGDLTEARAVVHAVPNEVENRTVVASFGSFWDLYWVLDSVQQEVLVGLTPKSFDDNRGTWGMALAQTHWLRGDKVRGASYADSARIALEQHLQTAPMDPLLHSMHGLALAYLGRKEEAIAEGTRGVALMPISKDAQYGPFIEYQLARIYILVGEPDEAVDHLEVLLGVPNYLSPGWLRVDPTFDPLRTNPRFRRLASGS